jgi:DNA-directed RNA polymerase subunit RPC12/RpoP
MFCPKCGHKIVGQKRDDGALKLQCDRCKVAIFSKPRNERELNIKIVLQKVVV